MFLARTDEQRRFEAALREIRNGSVDPGPSQVFVLHGLGGMGKTELCRRFAAIASGELDSATSNLNKHIVVTVNWQEERENHGGMPTGPVSTQPQDVLTVLHDAVISNPGVVGTRKLKKRAASAFGPYRRTLSHLPELQTHASGGGELGPDAWGVVLDEGLKMAGDAGSILTANPLPSSAATGMARAASAVRRSRKRDPDPQTVQIALRPAEAMTREFAKGLRDMSQARPVVMILDTYEIAASGGGWIRQVMRVSGDRVLWVVAARMEPEEEAGRSGELASFRQEIPEDRLRTIAMSRFNRQTIAEELKQRGAPGADDAQTLDLVASVSRGVPLAVGIVAGMMAQGQGLEEIGRSVTAKGDTSRLVRELTERYLLHTLNDPTLSGDITLLYGLALLYADRTDPDVLQALWGRDFEVLSTLSSLANRHDFVLTGTRRLHQEVRDTFRRYLLDHARRAELREANHRAAVVSLERVTAQADGLSLVECLESESWRMAVTTLSWHRFWEGNDEGLDTICGLFPAAILLHREFAHELVGIATFFGETFTPEQSTLLRGLVGLLSFGRFFDDWVAKRSAAFDGESSGGKPDGGTAAEEDRRAALRMVSERADGGELLPDSPPHAAIASLFVARSMVASDPEAALVALEEAAEHIAVDEGQLSAALGAVARSLAVRLVSSKPGGGASPGGLRVATLRTRYESASPSAWFGLAWAHGQSDRKKDARDAYQEVVDRFEGQTDTEARRMVSRAMANKGYTYLEEGDREGRCRQFAALVERFGGDEDRLVRREVAQGMFGLAVHLTEDDEPTQALKAYDEILEEFGAEDEDQETRRILARVLTNKALVQRSLGDQSGAGDTRLELVDLFGEDADPELRRMTAQALFALGVGKGHDGEREKAVEYLDRQLEVGDDLPALRDLMARGRIERAENLYSRGDREVSLFEEVQEEVERYMAGDDPSIALLEEYALFLAHWCEEPAAAKKIFERALEAGPEGGNCLANFAQVLFEEGDLAEGCVRADQAIAAATETERSAVLEVLFYLVALGPEERFKDALQEVRRLLEDGVRSRNWPLQRILARAEEIGRGDLDWLKVLSGVVNDTRPVEDLAEWTAWERQGD